MLIERSENKYIAMEIVRIIPYWLYYAMDDVDRSLNVYHDETIDNGIGPSFVRQLYSIHWHVYSTS
jgi:hypothetical protein